MSPPRCFFRGLILVGEEHAERKPCAGVLQRAHWIKQQTIKRRAPEANLWDERAWDFMCELHHHLFDHGGVGKIVVPRATVPVKVEEFAAEHGLGWYLDRYYGQPVAA